MARIMIVDDHPIFAESLAHRLKQEPDLDVVALAENEDEAMEILDSHPDPIDLALLDIRMSAGETEGLELAEYIRKHFRFTRVIMLSMHKHGAYIHRMFNAGIAGYMLKNVHIDDVLKGIRKVLDGKRYYPEEIRDAMDGYIMGGEPEPVREINLTPTEEYILSLIAEGLNSREISEKMGNKESTVEVHRRNILAKFGVKKVALLIKEAIRQGFISVDS